MILNLNKKHTIFEYQTGTEPNQVLSCLITISSQDSSTAQQQYKINELQKYETQNVALSWILVYIQ